MTSFRQDIRYALRTLGRSPGFTAAAILTLAVGIGGACTIFAGVNALLLRALPLPGPDRLVALWAASAPGGFDHANVSYRDFEDWHREARSFERLAAFRETSPTLTGRGGPEVLPVARVSADFFGVVGAPAFAGRLLTGDDDRPNSPRVVVLSHGAWLRRFGARAQLLGETLTLDGQAFTVVGVLPPGFALPGYEFLEAWAPFGPDLGAPDRGDRGYKSIGRLRPGVSLAQARAELGTIARRLAAAYPKTNTEMTVNAVAFSDDLFDDRFRVGLMTLLGSVGLVLLIGCANIAQLLLSRARTREREVAVRTALGASRSRIVRQMLTECLVLALLGGGLGLLLAVWGVEAFGRLLPEGTARLSELHLDGRVFFFGIAVSVGTAAAFGLLPSLQASRAGFAAALQDASSRGGTGGRRHGLQGFLVASEVALALVLLVGAGLLAKSLSLLRQVDPGFQARNVLTMEIDLAEREYTDDAHVIAFFVSLLDRVRAAPGVEAAAVVDSLPMGGSDSWTALTVEGRPPVPAGQEPHVGRLVVSPDYFCALGTPLLQGRPFARTDTSAATPVAVVNEEMARRFWPGQSAIGKRFKRGRFDSERPWIQIVGIARNVRHRGVSTEVRPEMYFPLAQVPDRRSMALVVRTASDPAGAATMIRGEVHAVSSGQAVSRVRTMEQLVSEDTAGASLLTGLIAAFALAAVGLATMGLYAVVSLSVGQSTREIGIRMALGAQARDVMGLILRRWMGLTLAGMVVGLAVALAVGKLVSTLLYTVRPTDAAVLSAVTALLAAVALVASYVPARRATRLDPSRALRAE
jgi:putative ABC transport system permease protein